jgi:hypothetical protein
MGDHTHRDNINIQLSGFFTGAPTEGSPTGGNYAFNETDMRTLIKNWLDLARSYDNSLVNAHRMSRIKPPAEDFASQFHAGAANQSGESYRRYLEHNRDYCDQQAQLFQNTLDDYLNIEHNNVTEMNKTAHQGPQPGV